MELEKSLQFLGLNEKEAKVYLALLQMGKGTVPSIATRADIKRPTAYLILDELRKKGLVNLLPRKVKAIYTVQSPQILLAEQREKEEIITQKMPELMAIYNSQKEKPKVQFYQGEKRLIELYNNEIFEEKEVLFFGSIKAIPKNIINNILTKFKRIVTKREVIVREILQADDDSIKFKEDNETKFHVIKIAPKEYKFPTDNVIFGNKLAIFSYKDEPMAVVIESSDVVKTYKSMFEIVWKSI